MDFEDLEPSDGYLAGKVLIASPLIGDPRFDRTVVFLCAHGDDHAMGLILNKPMDSLRLPALFEQLGVKSEIHAPDRAVLNGGPVDRDRGFVLHTDDYETPDSTLAVASGIGLTATREILEAIASNEPPRRSVLALGYAGWDPGQLEDEIQANAWLVGEPDEAILFDDDYPTKWARALKNMGVTPEFLIGASGHA
jgi:putative transcriptional regulator